MTGAAETDGGDEGGVVSLARGLGLLRAFGSVDAPLSNREIADRTGLPKPTVARLTYTLVRTGHLRQREPNGPYRLGDGVARLGESFLRSLPVRGVARPLMQAVADRYDVSVALGMPERSSMAYIEYCSGPDTVVMRLRAGSPIPMALTAMGRAYLWALPRQDRERNVERLVAEAGGGGQDVADGIARAFADLDRGGFCLTLGEWRSQMIGAAAPVVLDGGRTILALNCGASRQSSTETALRRKLGPALVRLSTEIANAMDAAGRGFWGE